jgi:hypothetical protein
MTDILQPRYTQSRQGGNTVTRYLTLVLLLVFIHGCSAIRVSQDYEPDYDFSQLKTWAWKPTETGSYGVLDNDLLDERIRTAITRTFNDKGYATASNGRPDFYVSYQLKVEQKIGTRNVGGSVMFGYGGYGRFGGVGLGTGAEVESYDEGALLIDVTDSADNKLVWRGVSTQKVTKHTYPQASMQAISETVTKMLQQFPPEPERK